ncbi:MAG: very short patch repair endonuclease [Acidobacteriota bacterium]|nr:very short patch repair endonuclease [Acidobacteriota bacterium]
MVDTVSAAQRSQIMSRIRSEGTKPEIAVRRLTHSLGYRYRLHRKDLPGTPDLVFPSRRKVIFVHGCFWHQHRDCDHMHVPQSNRDYWLPKLRRNAERDSKHERRLAELGWKTLVLWECEVSQGGEALGERIRDFLDESAS